MYTTTTAAGAVLNYAEWSVILEPILHRKPVRGDSLLCNRWQTSAQAYTA